MIGSHNRPSDRARSRVPSAAATIVVGVACITFLVLVGTVTSRAARDALRRGDVARNATAAGPQVGAAKKRALSAHNNLAAVVATKPSPPGGRGAPRTHDVGHAISTVQRSAAKPDTAVQGSVAGTGPQPVATPAGASSPTTAPLVTAAGYVAPTVVATAVRKCTVDPAGAGVVTYSVAFQGGAGWAPGANFKDGAYTLKVVGGRGAGSGLDAVINGAPVLDTADGVQTYVRFPAGLVVEARC
jgi:hypothetical protein